MEPVDYKNIELTKFSQFSPLEHKYWLLIIEEIHFTLVAIKCLLFLFLFGLSVRGGKKVSCKIKLTEGLVCLVAKEFKASVNSVERGILWKDLKKLFLNSDLL